MPIYFPRGAQGDLPAQETTHQAAHRKRQTDYVHRSVPRSIDPRGKEGAYNPIPFPGAIMARTTSALNAATVNGNSIVPGTGTADLYFMESIDSTEATKDPDRTNSEVLNWYVNNGNSIATNTQITVIQSGQFLLFLGADCNSS